jgi:hypothetical protein
MPGLNRYLRVTAGGLLSVDAEAIRKQSQLDGKWLLRCSDPSISAEDIALGYHQLLEVERGWRGLKTHLDLCPCTTARSRGSAHPRARAAVLAGAPVPAPAARGQLTNPTRWALHAKPASRPKPSMFRMTDIGSEYATKSLDLGRGQRLGYTTRLTTTKSWGVDADASCGSNVLKVWCLPSHSGGRCQRKARRHGVCSRLDDSGAAGGQLTSRALRRR